MKRLFTHIALLIVTALVATSAFGQKLKSEEIVAKHLESLGNAEVRASIKNRMAIGHALVKFVSQKNQAAEGRVVLVSANTKNFFGITLNANDYSGERFVSDGKKSYIGFADNGVRSVLGNFVQSNSWIIEDSVWSGWLASTWILAASTEKAKFSADGIKKIDGKEAYVLGYSRKGGGDVEVKLYFDKDTFRHVRTEYKRTSSAGIGRTPEQSSRFSETRHKVVERFSDFKNEKGLMLPHGYNIVYSVTGQNGTTEIEWNFSFSEFAFNQNLDEKTFSTGTGQ